MSDVTASMADLKEVAGVAWWAILIQGIAAVVLGLFLLARPAMTTVLIVQFIGVWWLLTGVLAIVQLFWDRQMWGLKLLMGIVGILAGVMVIGEPLLSPIILGTVYVIIIGVQGLIIGGVDLYRAFTGGGWGPGVMGALSLLFGIIILSAPMLAASALPWIFGFLGVVFGTMGIVAAVKLKKAFAA